jgi:hypothetical protein
MAPAPTAAPAPAGPQTFRGIYRFGFEVSSFEGCSLRMSDGGGWEEFARRHPEIADTRSNGAVYEYQMAFEGSRQAGGQYGHMGRYDCEYSVTRLLDSRRIPSPPSR